jgi:non-heme chloroperoxidase
MREHQVRGSGGLRLHVREGGVPDGAPILFVHGIAQCHMCWSAQVEGTLSDRFRLVCFDLRGHGMSQMPLGAEHYREPEPWADDVAAVIDALGLQGAVLVGWSLGGMVACDYLLRHGDAALAGVNFVGAAVTPALDGEGLMFGPGITDHLQGMRSHDLPTRIDAIRAFLRDQTHEPMAQDLFERAVAWNMVVPPEVRAGIGARERFSHAVLERLRVPVLVSHGRRDTAVLPRLAEYVAATCPTARASWYDDAAHQPFPEEPSRFNGELAAFVEELQAAAPVS